MSSLLLTHQVMSICPLLLISTAVWHPAFLSQMTLVTFKKKKFWTGRVWGRQLVPESPATSCTTQMNCERRSVNAVSLESLGYIRRRMKTLKPAGEGWPELDRSTQQDIVDRCIEIGHQTNTFVSLDLLRTVSVWQECENRGWGGGDWAARWPQEKISHQMDHHTQRHKPSVEWRAFCLWKGLCP